METLYIFLDEGGNFDFSPNGTQYFTMSSVVRKRPFILNGSLDNYKYDLIEENRSLEYFHCAQDNRYIREKVFDFITNHTDTLRVDSLIVEKRKTGPALREEKRFYPEMLNYLLKFVLQREDNGLLGEVVIITDTIPVKRKLKAVEKAVKQTLSANLPEGVSYRILHHASKSHYGLQIADYCNWAIYRKWQTDETMFYDKIKPMIRSEFEIFKNGERYFY